VIGNGLFMDHWGNNEMWVKIRAWLGGVAIALIQTLQECIFLSGSESEDVFAPRIVMET
jgi:intracellular septation protein A